MNVLQSHRQPSNADDTASIAQPSVSPPPQRQTTDRNYLLDSRDVAALADPHSPLSDAVLDFALNRYLERLEHTRPDLVEQVHLFGTHFATFLSAVAERNGDWESVLCGTRSRAGKPGVDLFAKRFLVVPTFLPGSEEVFVVHLAASEG
jgi:Ulp1 family protease